jgi:flagellar basal-body rod protein FlgF
MQNGTMIALSRLIVQQRALDVSAGNIANANTPGYRAARTLFSDWMLRQPGSAVPRGGNVLSFVQDQATWHDQRAGAMSTTGNPLDLAIGDSGGYFTVNSPSGPRLTRSGHFTLSPTGTIVDAEGNSLLDRGGQPLTVGPTDTRITVAADGSIDSENGAIGTIGVVTPRDPTRLSPQGDRLMEARTPTDVTPLPRLVQGAVEGSNVQAVEEISRMMTDLREFQFVSQYVQGESDRQNGAIEKLSQRPA